MSLWHGTIISNKVLLQWGTASGTSSYGIMSITFPKAFPKRACTFICTKSMSDTTFSSTETTYHRYVSEAVGWNDLTVTGVTIGKYYGKRWIAIGY